MTPRPGVWHGPSPGSNWPVSNRASSYAEVLGIVKPYVARKGPEAERWFYAEASRAAYRWVESQT